MRGHVTYDWWDISKYIPKLSEVAHSRDSQKQRFLSTKNWSVGNSTHFVGLCAEFCVFLESGMMPNMKLQITGDDGYDFIHDSITYDAKGSTFWSSPDLKEFPNKTKHSDVYILVAIKDYKLVKLIGWATRQQLIQSSVKNYGYGNMHSMTYDDLAKLNQLGLPPELIRRSNEGLEDVKTHLQQH